VRDEREVRRLELPACLLAMSSASRSAGCMYHLRVPLRGIRLTALAPGSPTARAVGRNGFGAQGCSGRLYLSLRQRECSVSACSGGAFGCLSTVHEYSSILPDLASSPRAARPHPNSVSPCLRCGAGLRGRRAAPASPRSLPRESSPTAMTPFEGRMRRAAPEIARRGAATCRLVADTSPPTSSGGRHHLRVSEATVAENLPLLGALPRRVSARPASAIRFHPSAPKRLSVCDASSRAEHLDEHELVRVSPECRRPGGA
jgi:hypothetical protein